MTSSLHKLRVDAAMDAYVDWREACAGVRDAYRGWDTAAREDSGSALRTYLAALDREERASQIYARLIRMIEPPGTRDPALDPRRGFPSEKRAGDERHAD